MARWAAALLLGGAAWVATQAAERPEPTRAERLALDDVHDALRAKDCARVATQLNGGLKREYPGFFMLAGVLYEEGLCLKPNWERAERMYLRAQAAGHTGGLLRLVSGFAVPGRDPAAALWWVQQAAELPLPEPCRVQGPVAQDPELFVATLKLWAPARLAACVHTVGVLATLAGDVEYPALAEAHQVEGEVSMVFEPASGQLQWRTEDVRPLQMLGVVSGDVAREQGSRKVAGAFEQHLRRMGEHALARYPRPEGIPPEWQLRMRFLFAIR